MKCKWIIIVLGLAILFGACASYGLVAPRIVNFWVFTPCYEEWIRRRQDIEKQMNILLNITLVPQNRFIEKLRETMTDGRDYPDIIEWIIENNRILSVEPKLSLVSPLEKFAAKSEVFKHVSLGRVSYLAYGKHIYGLPHDVHPAIFIYNDTLWKSVGVDMETIETWDDFFQAAVKLSAEQKEGKPLHYALPQNDGMDGTMFMIWQQSGAQFLDPNGKPCFTSPAFQQFMEKWVAWLKTGAMRSWDWGNFGSLLKSGGMASFITPDWWVSQVNDAAKAGVQFRARPLPLYRKGSPPTASWGGSFLAVCKLAKDQDFLYKVIEYMQYSPVIRTRYRDTGMLPAIDTLYDDASYSVPNPKFGGQKIGELQTSMARQIPSVQSGDIFWDAINDFNTVYPDMVSGKISVAEGLQKVQDVAMKRYKELKLK
jgi:ABC-type glycerol-3-phosphate transport system substrate-binding protein